MPATLARSVALAGSADDVEASFYEALQTADIELLMSCWADEDSILCIHPGGARLVGVAAIRTAFDELLSNGGVSIQPQQVRKIETANTAVHSVVERIDVMTPQGPQQVWILATNVYHKTGLGWRMVAHHASPGTTQAIEEVGVQPMLLH